MLGKFFSNKRSYRKSPSELQAEIWVVEGLKLGERWSLEEGNIVIGRGVDEENSINFPDAAKFISSRHAQFSKSEDGYAIEDLGSKNGIFVNGKKVRKSLLFSGDEIDIGQVVFRIKITEPEQEENVQEASVTIKEGPRQGERWSLENGDIIVGREIEGDDVISIPDTEKSVSTEHAAFRKQRGVYWIQDLNSKNGTYVNKKRVIKAELKDGDLVSVGAVCFIVKIKNKE